MAFLSKALRVIAGPPRSPAFRYGFAILATLVAFLLRRWADPLMPPGFPFLTFFPAVIITALLAGLRAGVLASLLSGLAAWYFFIPPAFSFVLDVPTSFALAFFLLVVGIDIAIIHMMKMALVQLGQERERALRAEAMAVEHARHRDVLFAELRHRISNNLQIVSALLALQRADVSDRKAREALSDASSRLALIGKIHRRLYDPGSVQGDFALFLRELADDLILAAGVEHVQCRVSAAPASLATEKMVPLALIVAELVSNCLEHAFIGRARGGIDLVLTPVEGGRLCLIVSDDGIGLPAGFDPAQTQSLGLRLVGLLAQQLDGRFEMRSAKGAEARLIFSAG